MNLLLFHADQQILGSVIGEIYEGGLERRNRPLTTPQVARRRRELMQHDARPIRRPLHIERAKDLHGAVRRRDTRFASWPHCPPRPPRLPHALEAVSYAHGAVSAAAVEHARDVALDLVFEPEGARDDAVQLAAGLRSVSESVQRVPR